MVPWRYCSVALRSSCPRALLLLSCSTVRLLILPYCPVLSCSDSNPPLWPLLSNPTSDLLFVFMDASLIGCLGRSRSWSPRARSLALSHPIHPLAHLLLLRQPTNPTTPPPPNHRLSLFSPSRVEIARGCSQRTPLPYINSDFYQLPHHLGCIAKRPASRVKVEWLGCSHYKLPITRRTGCALSPCSSTPR
jgi:hypothetical protein